uniref:Uncharacterized protein n=1 Tax=Vertebrata thuyoides TaxID=2006970 RepID=A0A1Z1MB47_9FLOR|nr:hypothetical protein [Vertebrata thuyoides]ARW63189.1 hypothetical protein [Vertebrata thuyoides]
MIILFKTLLFINHKKQIRYIQKLLIKNCKKGYQNNIDIRK